MDDRTESYQKMDDVEREEEPWGVSLIKWWRESSNSLATAHENTLQNLIIPMVMAPLSSGLKYYEYISDFISKETSTEEHESKWIILLIIINLLLLFIIFT